jgi:hypothetical protein
MFPKEENKEKRTAFWTAYGMHMKRHSSFRGPKTGWLNYRTGMKDIYFRQDADAHGVRVAIDIQHADASLREVYYDQFWELETLLHTTSGAIWHWDRHCILPTGEEISRIHIEKKGLNIYHDSDWPAMFLFFEAHILSLDEIWANAYDVFKDLEN